MDIKEIVNLLYTAIDLAADGGPEAFTDEEYSEMHELLKKIKSGQFGWHPATELPPVDDAGDSEWLVVILMNNEILRASYNSNHEGWYREDGSKIYSAVKRWCYPPLND